MSRPREIDAVLAAYPGVKLTQTVGVPHETLGEMVVSCIVPHEGAVIDEAAIRDFAKERLASYKVPRRVLFFRRRRAGDDRQRQGEGRRPASACRRAAGRCGEGRLSSTRAKIRFGVTSYGGAIAAHVSFTKLVEDLGFDLIGYGDTQNMIPDCYVVMTAMALAHPARDDRADGQQPGHSASGRHRERDVGAAGGLERPRLLRRRAPETARSSTSARSQRRWPSWRSTARRSGGSVRGTEVTWRGQRTRLQFEPRRVPIWIAAEGPKTQHLAGRIADGVIFANGITEEVVQDNLRRVREGAISAGRDPDSIECWFFVKPYFSESEQQAWHDLAWTLSASANHAFRFSFEDKFVPKEHEAGLKRLMAGYASHQHNVQSSGNHNARIVIENDLTEFLGRRFLLAGTAARIRERLEEMASWGATNLILTILFGEPVGYAKRLAREVVAPLSLPRTPLDG